MSPPRSPSIKELNRLKELPSPASYDNLDAFNYISSPRGS